MSKKINLLLFILIFFSFSSKATVVYVDSAHVGGVQNGMSWATAFSNFQSGINAANAGDSVWVAKGTYQPAINLSYYMKEGVGIYGGFLNTHASFEQRNYISNLTILKGNTDVVVIWNGTNWLTAVAVLDGFTITGGSNTEGGGMYNAGASPTIRNCIFSGNGTGPTSWYSCYGAGMYNIYSSSPTISNCKFVANTGYSGAGIYNTYSSSPTINNCIFSDNICYGGGGGGIYNDNSSPIISDCSFSGNSIHAGAGGGMFSINSSPTISNCSFSDNICYSSGGGMYNENSSPIINNCTFNNNGCTDSISGFNGSIYWTGGGGIYNSGGSPTISNCSFLGNTTYSSGGGIFNTSVSSLTISNCSFSTNNSVYVGGGIYNLGSSPIISDCSFSNNSGGFNGGSMFNTFSSPTINNCNFSGNISYQGGGIANYFFASPTINNCSFSGNKSNASGGGMYNYKASPIINNCIFHLDSAQMGGAIHNDTSFLIIANTLFSQNIAHSIGAAILNNNSSSMEIINSTFVKNKVALNGSSIYNVSSSSLFLSNTIIWGNYSGISNVDSSSFNAKYSLIQGLAANTATFLLDVNTNPLFVDTTNGDYSLRFDSPCINKGNNDSIPTGISTDLAGNNRIAYDTVDMGAYEYKLAIALGKDTTICNNNGYTLNADNIGSSYLWNTGATTQSITVNNTGTYIVEVSNTWGTVTDTIQVNISSPPVVALGNDTTINQGSSITLDAGNPGSTYLWNTGATTQTINVTTSGTYSVAVTNSAGCTGTDTIVVTVNPLGINDINTSKNSLIISPNPSKETIRISFTDEKLLHTKALLTDIYGRTVREVMLNSKSQQLSMAGLSSGIYILKTITGNSTKIIKE